MDNFNLFMPFLAVCTFFRGPKTVVLGDILNVVDESGVGQQRFVLVDSVDRVLEGQLSAAVLLVLGENGT